MESTKEERGFLKEGGPNVQKENGSEEDKVLLFDEQDVAEGIGACNHGLIGRVMTKKPINRNCIHMALRNNWSNPNGFKVVEIRENTFQFFFDEEVDILRVLKVAPWVYCNSRLILLELFKLPDLWFSLIKACI